MTYTISHSIFDSTEDYLRQSAPALLYLLHPYSRQSTVRTGTALNQIIFGKIKSLCDNLVNS